MLDIKMIRQNPDDIKARLATRGVEAETIDTLLEKIKNAVNFWCAQNL